MSVLDISLAWWIWVVAGFVLLFLELLDGNLVLFGLGIAAVSVGVIDYFYDMKFIYQLLSWAGLSVAYVIFWKIYIQNKKDPITNSYIGKVGIVIEDIDPIDGGKVEFTMPVIGSRFWDAIADKPIKKGTKVKIVKVIQQVLKVEEVGE